jgi:predicted nucleic acid-binding protein
VIVVVDASVALKWFFKARSDEAHLGNALAILEGIDTGRVQMLQAPHFLAEVAAVLAREKPGEAHDDLFDLQRLEWQVVDDPALYATAVDLSIRLRQHLFDTLYHATALHTEGATLVTADNRYYDAARDVGKITLLADFALSG